MTQTKSKAARPHTADKAAAPARKTRIALVREMLERPDGASLDDLCAATGWQKHSVRAALSGLRKSGSTIERGAADSGAAGSVYRVVTSNGAAK